MKINYILFHVRFFLSSLHARLYDYLNISSRSISKRRQGGGGDGDVDTKGVIISAGYNLSAG